MTKANDFRQYNEVMPRRSEETAEPLLIDRAAAAELPSAESIREWAREKRAFISSVMSELAEERRAVAASIREEGLRAVMFEEFGGRDADPQDAYVAEVEGADIFIGILGKIYGNPLKTRFSATHTEYLHAERNSLRIAMWASDTPDREGPEQSFLNDVRTFHVVPAFRTIADLKTQVSERIRAIAAEDLAPWCKLGRMVFRATQVEDHGDTLTVVTRVRDDAVARALEEARGDQWNRAKNLRFTWSGRSRYVDVSKVLVTTTSARSKLIRLDLKSTDGPQDSSLQYSMDGLTPDDITEKALRTVLFGEPNPLARGHLAFIAEIDDPLQPLRVSPVSEEIVRPLAELLITDLLIGTGRAGRIVELKIGVPIRERRPFSLGWETPRRYANETIAVRNIRGEIIL
jgi:hypothetical protein